MYKCNNCRKEKTYLDIFINIYKNKSNKYDKYDIKELLKEYIYNNKENILDSNNKNIIIDFRVKKYNDWLKYVYEHLF